MKFFKKLLILASVVAAYNSAYAQNSYSGYFLDNYTYRYEINPAFGNSKGFVSMPVIGNFNTAIRGTLHLSDIFYKSPDGGKTMLFTNPGISVSEAMGKFGNRNKIGTNNKINLLSVGFKGFGGFNTITLSASANLETSLPKAFFRSLKKGYQTRHMTYTICSHTPTPMHRWH